MCPSTAHILLLLYECVYPLYEEEEEEEELFFQSDLSL
jgi:hypothetical protein